eukprot:4988619-Ditylum_brightwellii.AAC.2
MLSFTAYPCASMKYPVQSTRGIKLSMLAILASVEILVFSFCLLELKNAATLSSIITPPKWLLMLGWTAKGASTHQRILSRLSASRVKGILCVA